MKLAIYAISSVKACLRVIRLISPLVLILLCCSIHAQLNLSPIWCFGKNAGLDFSKNPPAPFTTPLVTSEGSAGVTNGKGELLFYTDGSTVYNKKNNVMLNGTGLTGSQSSSQSAIVLQHPSQKSLNQYYIFTTPEYAGSQGFCYSIVDMDDDNGQGAVVTKNVRLYGGVLSEQMQPAMHSNGVDYWIVIKGVNNNEILSFLVDQAGVTLRKTASMGNSISNTIGCMRFNKQYSQFAFTCYDYSGYVQICDFDNTTGTVSNPMIVDGLYDPYGVAFSPDGKQLYISHLLTRQVNQYDLTQYNKTDILASKYALTSTSFAYGQLSYAIDGKLYMSVTGEKYIARIDNPDGKNAACNFQLNAVNLGANSCIYGLPLFYDYDNERHPKIEKFGECLEDTIRFTGSGMDSSDVLKWQLDTGTGFFTVSNTAVFERKINRAGNYKLRFNVIGNQAELAFTIKSCTACERKIPNVFTPNADHVNDSFGLASSCTEQEFNMSIYNRWGEKLFEADRSGQHWNGTYQSQSCSPGVYFYLITYKDTDQQQVRMNGIIQLIR
jgi:gliding motility-associated-like protein